jgi:hypothetical protein
MSSPPLAEELEQVRPHGADGHTSTGNTCAWCLRPASGRILIESGRTERDHQGRRVWLREISAPICEEHDATLQRRGNKADAEARHKIRAREWRAQQMVMFDARAFQTGAHDAGWWTP